MKNMNYYYKVKPIMKEVSKKKFVNYINNYPRKLEIDILRDCDPPYVSFNDFELADIWDHSVVASTFLYDDNPEGCDYEPEKDRIYNIMINYKKVFNSRTGNKTID